LRLPNIIVSQFIRRSSSEIYSQKFSKDNIFSITGTKVCDKFCGKVRTILLQKCTRSASVAWKRCYFAFHCSQMPSRWERKRERERVDRWLVVADGRSTVIVPGNRKRVITLRIEWKIVRRHSTAFACIPGCVCRPAFAAIPAVSMLHGQPQVRKHFHIYEVIKIVNCLWLVFIAAMFDVRVWNFAM